MSDKHAQVHGGCGGAGQRLERAEWQRKVQTKLIDGVLAIESSNPQKIAATYRLALCRAISSSTAGCKNALNRGAIKERLIDKGVSKADADACWPRSSIDTLQLDKNGKIGKSNGELRSSKGYLMRSCSP